MGINQAVVDLIPNPLVRAFAAPYVAGIGLESGVDAADRFFRERKFLSTLDVLGEELNRDEDVETAVNLYLKMAGYFSSRPHCSISVKPTGMGIHNSYEYCRDNVERVVKSAVEHRIDVTIDMEDHTLTDITLRMYRELREKYENVGTVLQSRLFRTDKDIHDLRDIPARIRLCIGIYVEPSEIAITNKAAMKRKLLEQAGKMFDYGHTVEFATHDERTIDEALALADRKGVAKERYEFQFLMGVPRGKLQRQLIADGIGVRLYVPFANEWKDASHYCKRRLANNPNMAFYILANLLRKILSPSA
ncbi:MAG: proline dehydrogenase family protein [Candidatus Eisenbacteria sp.]|nr:proline dehydrogenase family protein [Candidatus Eisenbacteria bacterium]